jgi:hypothetical protein
MTGGNPLAGKFLCEFLRDWRAIEIPEQVIASDIVLMWKNGESNSTVAVKGINCIEPLAEAAGWHGGFHDKRKIASDGLLASGHLKPR